MAGLHNEVLPHSRGTIETWGSDPSSAPIAVLAVHGRGQGPGYMRMLFERIDVDAFIAAPAADDASWYPASFLRPLEENQPGLDGGIAAIERALQLLQEHLHRLRVEVHPRELGEALRVDLAALAAEQLPKELLELVLGAAILVCHISRLSALHRCRHLR